MKLGIVGLPNVGKSTLFNAITSTKNAEAANYPFCTIEPNSGIVAVPDKRLDKLAEIWQTNKKTPAIVEFVDIAGLVKGASQGAGLGNKFLGHIRECDAIVHVVRCFDDDNIIHVVEDVTKAEAVDPIADIDAIDYELILSDLEVVQNRAGRMAKAAKSGNNKGAAAEAAWLQKLADHLSAGKPARSFDFDEGDAEQQAVLSFAKQIDLENAQQILEYGASAQKNIADFSDTALAKVKTGDLGEIGDMLSGLLVELKTMDEPEKKGIAGLFRKAKINAEEMKSRFATAEVNVDRISGELEKHKITLLKDVAVMDQMYERNLQYFKELTMYILAGKQKLAEARSTTLHELRAKAEASNLPEDAQAANDFENKCVRFEKKLHDLELTRMISLQTAPQIRMIQNNDTALVEKIQTSVLNTIPLWKNQMVLTLGIENSRRAMEAQRQVTDMTNALLQKNADMLHMASVETAKESERGIVDMETLKHTNEQLISTLDEVLQIQTDGAKKRQEAEAELRRLEGELKQKLLQPRS